MGKQLNQLRRRPRLIVGTPGRINDHLDRGNIDLGNADFLVLDETDRMLDMGFTVQLERIFKFMPKERQTLMFSATLPKNILTMSEKYLNNPKRVSVGAVNVIAKKIKQEVIRIEQDKKYEELTAQLSAREGSVIVFVKTKHGADKMAKNLCRDGFTADALHGDLQQRKRDRVMRNFRDKSFRILIATDIAARGLDVPHIEHVINYDLPQVAEDFIHRMGRTARAGKEGSAISFVSRQDGRKWFAIERLLNPDAKSDKPAGSKSGHRKGRGRGKPRQEQGQGKRPAKFNKSRSPNGQDGADENRGGNSKPRRHKSEGAHGKPSGAHAKKPKRNSKPIKAGEHNKNAQGGKSRNHRGSKPKKAA